MNCDFFEFSLPYCVAVSAVAVVFRDLPEFVQINRWAAANQHLDLLRTQHLMQTNKQTFRTKFTLHEHIDSFSLQK